MAYGRGNPRTRQTNMRISDKRIQWLKTEMEKVMQDLRKDDAKKVSK